MSSSGRMLPHSLHGQPSASGPLSFPQQHGPYGSLSMNLGSLSIFFPHRVQRELRGSLILAGLSKVGAAHDDGLSLGRRAPSQ